MTEQMVALGVDPSGRAIPIRLMDSGALNVSGGSEPYAGAGAYNGMLLLGAGPDGRMLPISVDRYGNVQGGGSSGSTGTVTSVGMTVPNILSVAGSPITTSGTLAVTLATQTANTVFAGATSGGAATPAFRALVGADLPATITKATNFNIAGAASAPALTVSGVPFAGTGTTSFPQVYINDAAATASTTLSTAGTYLGVNGHGTADLANLMLDGVSKFTVSSAGVASAVSLTITGGSGNRTITGVGNYLLISSNVGYDAQGVTGWKILSTGYLGWSASSVNGGITDVLLTRLAAASLSFGAAASASPVAYTLTVGESSRGGTDTNVAGASATIRSGTGTGTGAASSIVFQTPTVGSTGSVQQTYADRLTVVTAGITATVPLRFPNGSAATPGLSLAGATDYGLYETGSGLGIAAQGLGIVRMTAASFQLASFVALSWGATLTGTPDLYLQRDAANVLAQRNGTTAQVSRIYNTYTDASNYEVLTMGWSTNTAFLTTNIAGTGSPRSLVVGTTGAASLLLRTSSVDRWAVDGNGYLVAQANYNIWNGTSALATNATAGFLGVNSCAGTPTGVPASIPTGQTPLVFDSTNLRLYAYTGGAWKSVLLA